MGRDSILARLMFRNPNAAIHLNNAPRLVVRCEADGGLERLGAFERLLRRLTGEQKEAGVVLAVVFDAGLQDLSAVEFRRGARGDGGNSRVVALHDRLYAAAGCRSGTRRECPDAA